MGLKYVPAPDEADAAPRATSRPPASTSWLGRVHKLWRIDSTLAVCCFVGLPLLIIAASILGDLFVTLAVMLGLLILALVTNWAIRRWGPKRPVIEARCALCGQGMNDPEPLGAAGSRRCPECGSATR
ncbi:MAG: hypothetical protein AABZ53_12855 [Planctomycetota bacterium]